MVYRNCSMNLRLSARSILETTAFYCAGSTSQFQPALSPGTAPWENTDRV
jgi:hypothetical protein